MMGRATFHSKSKSETESFGGQNFLLSVARVPVLTAGCMQGYSLLSTHVHGLSSLNSSSGISKIPSLGSGIDLLNSRLSASLL
jgi:hypothetical protein